MFVLSFIWLEDIRYNSYQSKLTHFYNKIIRCVCSSEKYNYLQHAISALPTLLIECRWFLTLIRHWHIFLSTDIQSTNI
jgi:hypothetical protein